MPEALAAPPAAPTKAMPPMPPANAPAIPASSIGNPTAPTAAKPGSARDRMQSDLAKKIKPGSSTDPSAPQVKPPVEEPKVSPEDRSPETLGEAAEATGETPTTTETPKADGKKDKPNPWRMYDAEKAKVATLEKQVSELKGGNSKLAEPERLQYLDRIEKAEKRIKEYEDHLRFSDYQKHPEYLEKFQQPYEKAWTRAMKEVGELTVDTADGQKRAVTADDIMTLVNLPLGQAREVAERAFGSFANDVMDHRKEIKNLFDAQQEALADARKNGGERQRQQMEMRQKQQGEMVKSISEEWSKAGEAITKHERYGKYFTPVEGDQDRNQRLAKGFELVDRAWSEDPRNPALSPEERAAVVRRHSAVRHRAGAFGVLVKMVETKDAENAKLAAKLKSYESSTPDASGREVQTNGSSAGGSARDRMHESLGKLVKR